jgi:hypothetical protein
MNWICPECYTEKDKLLIEGLKKSKYTCGYELMRKERKLGDGGWMFFLWACPYDI